MDLEKEILKEHSKRQTVKLARWIGSNKKRFNELMELFLQGSPLVTQRAAWIVSHCVEAHLSLAVPWLSQMIEKADEPGTHVAVKRNVVRLLQMVPIPKSLLGTVITRCFQYIESFDTPIAVKCYAMTVIANAAKQEPDLRHELTEAIRALESTMSAGERARSRKIFKNIQP